MRRGGALTIVALVVSALAALTLPAEAGVTRPDGATSGPWAATVEGFNDQVVRDVAVGPGGVVYVVGHTKTEAPVTVRQGSHSLQVRGEGEYSGFLAAFSASGG